ncbi:MAG: propionate catabolism operon regulatory protein PrpR [Proteobacteria bacterium]|nr:propionate catabolism operon regulatory protein PrpR [Pseudomonadota bacterium]
MERESGWRMPRICVISYKGLSRLVHAVVPEFEERSSIEVVDVLFDGAIDKAHQLERDKAVDVIVTAGANAAYLRSNIGLPVITIKISGFDVLLAMLKGRNISERVGIVTYLDPIPELEAVKEMLKLDISQRTYCTLEDATICVKTLAREGYQVVIGSSLVVEQAEQNGMQGILVYSQTAVRQAIEDALEIARVASLETARYDHLNGVLHNLREAVLSVNIRGRITAINPAMERMLGLTRAHAMERLIADIAPEISMDNVLATGQQEVEQVIQINQLTCIANRIPIHEAGLRTGAILTLQDARTIQQADTTIRAQRRVRQLAARYHFDQLVGTSQAFMDAKLAAKRYAKTDSTLLVTGESGTGKELFAQSIHNASTRHFSPFVAINCAAFPEPLLESEIFGYEEGAFTGSRKGGKQGLFEAAHTGTIFLDEIGDMPISLQSRLLRVLQEKEVVRLGSTQPVPIDVRVIAATHQSLAQRIEQGMFRADLYYRLNILHLSLPALRNRSEDIAPLALQLLYSSLRRLGSSLPADQALAPLMPLLRAYHWPGNVRELENICERLAVALSEHRVIKDIDYRLLQTDFPELFLTQKDYANLPVPPAHLYPAPSLDAASPAAEVDDQMIRRVLAEANNNRNLAAQKLGISRTTLWRRLRETESHAPVKSTET